ncbi:MAG: hypothetical protein E7051_10840 [Lentisphaerae bacterium]|nr:hypothetical protein [Lentisphaerota bacterium]
MSKVNFFRLTAAQYDFLENKDADTVYFLTDSKTIVLGTEKYVNEKKADKFLVQRVFAHDTYGTVAYLDTDNSMDLSGYFADGISQFELYLVSATPEITGNIVLTVGGESFTVPVTDVVKKVAINPKTAIKGIISIVRNTANNADTLNDGTDAITALVVDWRCS